MLRLRTHDGGWVVGNPTEGKMAAFYPRGAKFPERFGVYITVKKEHNIDFLVRVCVSQTTGKTVKFESFIRECFNG